MWIVAALIFREILGVFNFSNIVIVAADAGEYGICANGFGCGLVERSNHNGMLVGARCFDKQSL